MDNVAKLSAKERKELFGETAARRGFHEAIAEKDFWVCWVLMKLFSDAHLSKHLIFKGGTSLSKVHGLIDRFSEDIDLILDWGLLGYGPGGKDPWQKIQSNSKLDQFNAEFNSEAATYIKQTLCPHVQTILASTQDVQVRIAANDPQTIEVIYPATSSLAAIRPEVRLEIGPLASWVPSAEFSIQPYAAEEFPDQFQQPACTVNALKAERTFWEKATILHQQAHRTSPLPSGYSRHYYDLHHLANSPIGALALKDLKLLQNVVEFKERFYRSAWARYDLAKPGAFKLIPPEPVEKQLIEDYRKMQPMFFKTPPEWVVIIERLAKLQDEINSL